MFPDKIVIMKIIIETAKIINCLIALAYRTALSNLDTELKKFIKPIITNVKKNEIIILFLRLIMSFCFSISFSFFISLTFL